MFTRLALLICFSTLVLIGCVRAPGETKVNLPPTNTPTNIPPLVAPVVTTPSSPNDLPGNGLAQHDFFYAGEAKTRDMSIVRNGKVVWSYHELTGKGEISDAVLLSNGNVLFAHQFGVTEITPDQKVVWNYDVPDKHEVHTARPIGTDRVLFMQNGEDPKLILVNIVSGKTEREWPMPVKNPAKTHGQFRHMELTDAGTLLVSHMDLAKVSEYNTDGKEIWSVAVPSPWSASRLKNGNTLIASNAKFVREVDPSGKTVWEFTPADVPDYKVSGLQTATRLANGNTLINNWANPWQSKIDPTTAPVQAWEITPDKKVVWALRSWTEPANLGSATTIQLLDEPGAAENVHFGEIK